MKNENKKVGIILHVFLVCLAIVVDILEIIFDLAFESGVIINRFIDIGMVLVISAFFLFTDRMNSRIVRLNILTFAAEMIPDVDALPFWTMDVIYIIHLINKGKIKTYSFKELRSLQGISEIGMETATSLAPSPVPGGGQAVGAVAQGVENKVVQRVEKSAVQKTEKSVADKNVLKLEKNIADKNTLDLQNKRQITADKGTNMPMRSEQKETRSQMPLREGGNA